MIVEVVEHEIKKHVMPTEDPNRAIAANVRFDFNDFDFAQPHRLWWCKSHPAQQN
jgi:hypothetical protein